ncbi:dephospho-CoA kinase [Posidoniimonas polymericola]|uniref:dephospho-CoA kinase n=1 Tax=Posidoniimonas polymericola TaxID=2528002 RepID=UPI0018D31E8C|nr:dephospho-CoA kinase [Posidoniimonas polymericola]
MLTLGLIGGIASGKSTVGRLLAEHGAQVLDADQFAHQVLAEPEVLAELAKRWGDAILTPAGKLDRRQVAQRVFGESPEATAERRFLEGIVHPRVRELLKQALRDYAATGGRVAVLDIPLLIEAGWADDCDLVLFVDAPQSARSDRTSTRGWDSAELSQREQAQLPIDRKRSRADLVISNDADLATLEREIAELWSREIAPRLAG